MRASIETAVIALTARGGAPEHAARVAAMRRAFEERTGAFGPEDPWFEARSGAFWDDALVGGFARAVEQEVGEDCRALVGSLERAQRGLYSVHRRREMLLECAVTGAVFEVRPPAQGGLSDALLRADGFVEGWVAAARGPDEVALLPGAVFHAPQASDAIDALLDAARGEEVPPAELLDALLRMDRTFRAMPRAKPQLAYRVEALARRPVLGLRS